MKTVKQIAREIKFMTQAEANAIEIASTLTDKELQRAYGRNSILGEGRICDVYLREIDRRARRKSLIAKGNSYRRAP